MPRWCYIKNVRFRFERNWRSRAHPYWFNSRISGGMRRICVPFLCIDILKK